MLPRRLACAFAASLTLLASSAHAAPVTIFEPVSPPLAGNGTGLCLASAVSESPRIEFNVTEPAFNGAINEFLRSHKTIAPPRGYIESVVRTILDLSNNNDRDPDRLLSFGDFTGEMAPTCRAGGCDFHSGFSDLAAAALRNDTDTAFGARLRGYLNVTDEFAGQPIHFGLYTDDAVSLTFFGADAVPVSVITLSPQLGAATWRITETVTFDQPGLYPLEILYVEIVEHAALEMSYFLGSFTDVRQVVTDPGSQNLKDVGFRLWPPTAFFHTLSGAPSYPDLDQCKQCEREFANRPGNHGCDPGYYCNEAALCAPCDTAAVCGESCRPCGGDTPFCINVNGKRECGGCRDDYDCRDGLACDPETHTCEECNDDDDCPRGEICVERSCVPCDTTQQCAGNSCNCCPGGSNGKPMQCVTLDGTPTCVECTSNADCPGQVCDIAAGHCVDEVKPNARPDCCGDDCVTCPADVPYCLPGPVGTACAQCRNDMDCPDGMFCLSGECKPCVRDRHCGIRCEACEGDTPICFGTLTADTASCVRCTMDAHCNGGTCNPETHECEPGCMATCAAETPHCDGQKCVECWADMQCPCGNTCDLATNTCDPSCKTNGDCLGNEHCRWTEEGDAKECALGPMPDDVACGGTLADVTCTGSIGRKTSDPPPAGALALAILALLVRRRTREDGAAHPRAHRG